MPGEARSPAILRFGTFEVDLRAGELHKQGVRIKLQEQPFRVLTVLLQRPGEVVTREELRNQNWPPDTFVDFDNSLNTAINKLREALGDSAENPQFIETLPRRGYRFIAPVTGEGQNKPAPSAFARKVVLFAAAAVLLTSLALVGGWYWHAGRARVLTEKDRVIGQLSLVLKTSSIPDVRLS
jgi:DNA-binding winged helix-turn-helix (wHTH) protein